jgi:2-(1,2-epoxy-1,2-dihydrophenyl)acetyl-CoA isomerase
VIPLDFEFVRVKSRGAVCQVTLSRPEKINSLNMKMVGELEQALRGAARDPEVRVVVLTGEGKGFCAGGDVKEMHDAEDPVAVLRDMSRGIHRSVLELQGMPKPTVAGINGIALGAGLGLALACDITVAVEGAKLKAGFIGAGLSPGCGTFFLPKVMPHSRAVQMVLLEEVIDAEEAFRLGIVNFVEPPDKYQSRLADIIKQLMNGPTLAYAGAKDLLMKSYNHSLASHLEQESIAVSRSGETEDFREGVSAFAEKRRPSFKGK